MQTTARRKIPYPDLSGDDTPVDLPQLFHDRAVILDAGVDIDMGTLAQRPTSTSGTPGIAGRQFVVTDQPGGNRLDLDIGIGWVTVGPALVDAAPGVGSLRTLGTGPNQAVAGNDPRLISSQNASGDITGGYPGPLTVQSWNGQTKAAVVAGSPPQSHGSSHLPAGTDPVVGLTDASIAAANKDGAAGTASMRTLGAGSQQAMPGNVSNLTDSNFAAANKDGTSTTPSLRTLGSGAQQAVAGNDGRLTQDTMQPGIVGSGDYAISGISINAITGAVTFTLAPGVAWIKDSSGILRRTVLTFNGNYTCVLPSSIPAGACRAVVVQMDVNGVASIGNNHGDYAGLNATLTQLSASQLLPDAAHLQLFVVGIQNNGGTYQPLFNGAWQQGTNWLDRRPWARGAYYTASLSASVALAAAYAPLNAPLQARLEVESGTVEVGFNGLGFANVTNGEVLIGVSVDGGAVREIVRGIDVVATYYITIDGRLALTGLSPGSHLFQIEGYYGNNAASGSIIAGQMVLEEKMTPNANNGTA